MWNLPVCERVKVVKSNESLGERVNEVMWKLPVCERLTMVG